MVGISSVYYLLLYSRTTTDTRILIPTCILRARQRTSPRCHVRYLQEGIDFISGFDSPGITKPPPYLTFLPIIFQLPKALFPHSSLTNWNDAMSEIDWSVGFHKIETKRNDCRAFETNHWICRGSVMCLRYWERHYGKEESFGRVMRYSFVTSSRKETRKRYKEEQDEKEGMNLEIRHTYIHILELIFYWDDERRKSFETWHRLVQVYTLIHVRN